MAGHPRSGDLRRRTWRLLWRPDVIVLLLVAVGLAGYLAGVRRIRAAGGVAGSGRVCWAVAAAVGRWSP